MPQPFENLLNPDDTPQYKSRPSSPARLLSQHVPGQPQEHNAASSSSNGVVMSTDADSSGEITQAAEGNKSGEIGDASKPKPARGRRVVYDSNGDHPRPFKCTYCDKAFHRLEHQTRHIRTHTGERPHACTIPGCTKRFSRSDELTRHTRIHAYPGSRRAKQGNNPSIAMPAVPSNSTMTNLPPPEGTSASGPPIHFVVHGIPQNYPPPTVSFVAHVMPPCSMPPSSHPPAPAAVAHTMPHAACQPPVHAPSTHAPQSSYPPSSSYPSPPSYPPAPSHFVSQGLPPHPNFGTPGMPQPSSHSQSHLAYGSQIRSAPTSTLVSPSHSPPRSFSSAALSGMVNHHFAPTSRHFGAGSHYPPPPSSTQHSYGHSSSNSQGMTTSHPDGRSSHSQQQGGYDAGPLSQHGLVPASSLAPSNSLSQGRHHSHGHSAHFASQGYAQNSHRTAHLHHSSRNQMFNVPLTVRTHQLEDHDDHYFSAQRHAKRSRPNSPSSTAPPSPTFSHGSISPTPNDCTPMETPGHSPRLRARAWGDLPTLRVSAQQPPPPLSALEPSFGPKPSHHAAGSNMPTPQHPSSAAPKPPIVPSRSAISLTDIMNSPDTSQRQLPPISTITPSHSPPTLD